MCDCRLLLWLVSTTLSLVPIFKVQAQLTPDNTLGKENSIVNTSNLIQRIDGGAIRESNLFHSFQDFNIGNAESVYFSNPSNIKNILTRVTGKNSSSIFGKLGVLGNANLFLINPNGIIFGENATLDIGGSFIGSTADNIKFADGAEFNAVNPSANPILTINLPLGLQYGVNPGNIEIRGELQVPDSESLALIAGNIKLDGGNLIAQAGGIDLLAVKNGEVSLVNSSGKIKLSAGIDYGDIELNAANVDASGNSGGNIDLRGRNIAITDDSIISTNTKGNGSGETLNITATELLTIIGSKLFTDVENRTTGTGSDLVIDSKSLLVTDESLISSSTFGFGNGGDVTIETTSLQIYDASIIDVTTYSLGNAGDLSIETTNLQVHNSQIGSGTAGKGNAGNMEIKANLVELVGSSWLGKSGLFASALREDGKGGNLSVTANQLIIRDGATVNASNFLSSDPENIQGGAGSGAAGNININSPFILLENQAIITANANAGDEGNVNIQSQNLQLRQGSIISTNAKNRADGGNINISTNTLLALENSDITANSEGSFGGRVIIDAQGIFGTQFRQMLTPESDITATSSLGTSFNGVVDINTISGDPSSGLVELPQTLVDSSRQMKTGCSASAGNNFIVRGRGGLPQNPSDLFNGNTAHTELFDLVPAHTELSNIRHQNSTVIVNNQINYPKNKLIEATGWMFDNDGQVIFVANLPRGNQKYTGVDSVSCRDFSTAKKNK